MQYKKILNPIDVVEPHYLTQNMGFKELNTKSVFVVNNLCELTK